MHAFHPKKLVGCFLASLSFACCLFGQEPPVIPVESFEYESASAPYYESTQDCFFQTHRNNTDYYFSALARAYLVNDQRIEWTGQEETFGVEGVIGGAILRQVGCWNVGLETELFINQPFDRNILVDTPERVSYRGNFEIDPLEINQLYVEANRGAWSISFGKRWTPFGRFYFPLNTNELYDAPFLRTEVINWRETGLQLDYRKGLLDLTLACTNGSEDRDTNSSKAGIARLGINADWFVFGGSVKWQDGIGSESQKYRNNQFGFDMMVQRGKWCLSGEVTYDEYGFRRYFNPLDITWGRSIYNRDQFTDLGRMRGIGYYLNLNYCGERWTTVLNYGAYTPQLFTGDEIHDRTTYRGYIKAIRHFSPGIDGIVMAMGENDVPIAQSARIRKGLLLYTGVEYRF